MPSAALVMCVCVCHSALSGGPRIRENASQKGCCLFIVRSVEGWLGMYMMLINVLALSVVRRVVSVVLLLVPYNR